MSTYYVLDTGPNTLYTRSISGCQELELGEGIDYKGTRRSFWGNGSVLYPDCGGGYKTVFTFQDSSNPTPGKNKLITSKSYLSKSDF